MTRTLASIMALMVTGTALAAKPREAKLGKPAPAFTLNDQDGRPVSLAGLKGKWVVLEWVNADCPVWAGCAREGTMAKLAEQFAPQGVVWLGINTTHYATLETNRKTRADFNLSYAVLDDHEGKVGRAYGAKTTPHLYIVDPKGRLVYRGAINSGDDETKVNYIEQGLTELLAGKPCSVPETKPYGCSVKYKK